MRGVWCGRWRVGHLYRAASVRFLGETNLVFIQSLSRSKTMANQQALFLLTNTCLPNRSEPVIDCSFYTSVREIIKHTSWLYEERCRTSPRTCTEEKYIIELSARACAQVHIGFQILLQYKCIVLVNTFRESCRLRNSGLIRSNLHQVLYVSTRIIKSLLSEICCCKLLQTFY